MSRINVTVLASGGLDSTACLEYYLDAGHGVTALWVNYGQAASVQEEIAITKIVKHYGISMQKLRVKGIEWANMNRTPFEFRGRNLTLVSLALNNHPDGPGLIALGIHAGTEFVDCTAGFIQQIDQTVSLLSDGLIRLDCPFLDLPKLDVAQYALSQEVPVDLTYSCERGTPKPCRECAKCLERNAILVAL